MISGTMQMQINTVHIYGDVFKCGPFTYPVFAKLVQ